MEKMSETRTLRVGCPCCQARLVVDGATGEVLSHREHRAAAAGGKSFDDLLNDLDSSKAEAESVFEREMDAMKDRDRLLEEKFRQALERAAESPEDEPPPRPFDLD